LTQREREKERQRASTSRGNDRQKEKQTPRGTGSWMWDSIPGPWDLGLSQRQTLNRLSHPGAPALLILRMTSNLHFFFENMLKLDDCAVFKLHTFSSSLK